MSAPSRPSLTLTVRVNPSAADARRGIIRVHPEVLAALSLREWDAVSVTGARVTAAVVAATGDDTPPGTALLDDITFSNAGVKENAAVVISPATVHGATRVVVRGSQLATGIVDESILRRSLLGKVLSVGDTVSLLPRDLGPELAAGEATRALARSVGITWTNELLTVVASEPSGPVSVQTNTAVLWADAAGAGVDPAGRAAIPSDGRRPATSDRVAQTGPRGGSEFDADQYTPAADLMTSPGTERARSAPKPRPVAELVGVDSQVAKLTEWLRINLDEPDVLTTLGATPRLGVLFSGPAGAGKATIVRSVCATRFLVVLDGPTIGATEASGRLQAVTQAIGQIVAQGTGVLLITDVDALLPSVAPPATPEPVSTLILEAMRTAIGDGNVAVIATTAEPAGVDPRLRDPLICDRELRIGLPDAALRGKLLAAILRGVPADGDLDFDRIALRTPGFVAGDLAALTREAALRAATRASDDGSPPMLRTEDLLGALDVIRPASRSDSPEVSLGSLTLDDVGDMVETKQALTEAVLWPLQHPDTFTRLGVDPPRGVLLFGPPGCGKTFVVRALAASGQLSVHTVKGAELMDKWVGSSEKAVRDLFERARESAPSLIFLDEVDALAPRRGQSSDSGVADRVVASLLTELDGVEPLQDVVVLGATNRPDLIDPALLRPGRLERLVFVPPPDAPARADILRTSSKNVPLADDIDLGSLAAELDGYSAADCAALLREAALAAMRRDIDTAVVGADDLADARSRVRPSLDPAQVADLAAYAQRRIE